MFRNPVVRTESDEYDRREYYILEVDGSRPQQDPAGRPLINQRYLPSQQPNANLFQQLRDSIAEAFACCVGENRHGNKNRCC